MANTLSFRPIPEAMEHTHRPKKLDTEKKGRHTSANSAIRLHTMQQERSTHRSLGKGLEMLSAFSAANLELGTQDLSEKLGVHKSTVSRILRVLLEHGFVRQNSTTLKYSLGPSAIRIGGAAIAGLVGQIIPIAKPYLDELRDGTGETVSLEVMSGESTILAYAARGSHLLQVFAMEGDRMPINAAAGAKAILAYSRPDLAERLLQRELKKFTPKTITAPEAFMRKLVEFRKRGYSEDLGEINIDVHAVGAPIFNHSGKSVAAVVIAAPERRMKSLMKSGIVSKVKATARQISEALLYSEKG